MALYEHVFLTRQDASAAQVDALVEQFKAIIAAGGGKVGKVENWFDELWEQAEPFDLAAFRAVAERGIPAVRSKLGTVVETPAMAQLRVLAAAIADPANARLARALVLTWFVDLPHSAVLDDAVVERLQARCAAWGTIPPHGGWAGWPAMQACSAPRTTCSCSPACCLGRDVLATRGSCRKRA